MDKKLKNNLITVAFGVGLLVVLTHLPEVFSGIGVVISLLLPVVVGLLMAFVLNVPVSGFEKLFAKLFPKNKRTGWRRPVGLALTLLLLFGALTLLSVMVVPQMAEAGKSIAVRVEQNWPRWMAFLESNLGAESVVMQWIRTLDLREMFSSVLSGAGSVLGSVANVAQAAVSGVSTALIGFIIAIYVTLGKNTLGRQTKKFLRAYCGDSATDRICYVAGLCSETYSKFLSGQGLEALILGALIFLVFTIFDLPYAQVVAAVTIFGAFIPYVGAFFSCVVAVLLALLVSPQMALWCAIAYVVTQFVENQFIYPHVVGSSVGLSPLWTLAAAFVGGSLFGLVGIIFFIPLVAVIHRLVTEAVHARLTKKHPPEQTASPEETGAQD